MRQVSLRATGATLASELKAVREPGGGIATTPRMQPCLALSRSHDLPFPRVRKSIFGFLDFTSI